MFSKTSSTQLLCKTLYLQTSRHGSCDSIGCAFPAKSFGLNLAAQLKIFFSFVANCSSYLMLKMFVLLAYKETLLSHLPIKSCPEYFLHFTFVLDSFLPGIHTLTNNIKYTNFLSTIFHKTLTPQEFKALAV